MCAGSEVLVLVIISILIRREGETEKDLSCVNVACLCQHKNQLLTVQVLPDVLDFTILSDSGFLGNVTIICAE